MRDVGETPQAPSDAGSGQAGYRREIWERYRTDIGEWGRRYRLGVRRLIGAVMHPRFGVKPRLKRPVMRLRGAVKTPPPH